MVFVPSLTIKKFVVWLSLSFKSNGFPVVSEEPAPVILIMVDAVLTPRPTCLALTPPVPVDASPPDAVDIVWYISSLNLTLEALNASVFTLAILLPITSILVWCVLRPDTAENNDLIIVH